jgi:hypothetical protein
VVVEWAFLTLSAPSPTRLAQAPTCPLCSLAWAHFKYPCVPYMHPYRSFMCLCVVCVFYFCSQSLSPPSLSRSMLLCCCFVSRIDDGPVGALAVRGRPTESRTRVHLRPTDRNRHGTSPDASTCLLKRLAASFWCLSPLIDPPSACLPSLPLPSTPPFDPSSACPFQCPQAFGRWYAPGSSPLPSEDLSTSMYATASAFLQVPIDSFCSVSKSFKSSFIERLS